MNVGIAVVGLVAGLLIGGGIEFQRRRERAISLDLQRHGTERVGRVVALEATGRYSSHRRVTVEVDGRRMIETIPSVEAVELGLVVGGDAVVVGVDDQADPSRWRGRLVRERSFDRDRPVGVFVGLFIGVLGLATSFVG